MNNFSILPEALFDNILQFSDVKDIVSFSNTSTEHNSFVEKITSNSQTRVSTVYEMTKICDIETWIFLPLDKYKFKFAKQYYDIYKNLGNDFELEFKEVQQIFYGIFNLVKEIYHLEKDDEKNKKCEYIIMTLFNFINTNNCVFQGNFSGTSINGEIRIIDFNSRSRILDLLFKLYGQEFSFINYTEIETILINMYQDLINSLEDVEQTEKTNEFIVEYLEGWFYFTEISENPAYINLGYIREMLENMVVEAGLGTMFLIPEEDQEDDIYIDVDDMDE